MVSTPSGFSNLAPRHFPVDKVGELLGNRKMTLMSALLFPLLYFCGCKGFR
jgi:hypothetical protein